MKEREWDASMVGDALSDPLDGYISEISADEI